MHPFFGQKFEFLDQKFEFLDQKFEMSMKCCVCCVVLPIFNVLQKTSIPTKLLGDHEDVFPWIWVKLLLVSKKFLSESVKLWNMTKMTYKFCNTGEN